jgi:predicted short-subunit dehydrogenase-like oxidoreductase (DUF2520 family)
MPDPMPQETTGSGPVSGLRLAVAGPGRVGTTLAAWAALRGARLLRVGARRPEAAREAARTSTWTSGAEAVALEVFESADCDLLLVAVADGALPEVAAGLAGRPQAPVVLHTSGSLGTSVLAPLARSGAAGSAAGCFHPLKAFPRPLVGTADLERAAGTFYALDGPPAAVALGERLAAAFGGVAGVVPEAARDLYHLGATVAAGGVATLVVSAGELASGLELPAEAAAAVRRGYLELARGALGALAEASEGDSAAAITGPLARGDHATFLRELERLRAAGADAGGGSAAGRLELLCRLGLETVRLTAGDPAARRLAETLRERGLLGTGEP